MSIQKLHYENLGGILIRREGLLTWRCPLCKAEGQSPEVMRTCPECGSKDATLPGAQPAPSVPDATWLPVPDKHPTFDPVDLQLADGSVLCGCVPQYDGDYWWEGPSGEVFIDPRYAPVTHWRLSAAPEARQ